jgi:hypothetical protein
VLLVSMKLILNTYHMEEHTRRLEERIDDILSLMRAQVREHPGQSGYLFAGAGGRAAVVTSERLRGS